MERHVDPPAVTRKLDAYLRDTVIPAFQRDCFSSESLSYEGLNRRLAYGFHFAPKHAVVWRRYLLSPMKSPLRTYKRFNSIGTGPGSEIIGILEASLVPKDEKVEIVCLEREQEWREIFEAIMETYLDRSGRNVDWTYTNDPEHLMKGAPVVGSCVLSELGREKRISSFLEEMREQVGPVRARFLDFPSFPRETGTRYIEDAIPGCSVIKIYERGWDLRGELNAEMDNLEPCYCKVQQTKEPGMRMHLFRF